MLRLVVDARHPDAALVEEAARLLRGGAIAAVPTDTLYGLAADPFSPAAVAKVFAAKGRAADQALPLVAADVDQVARWIGPLSDLASRLAARFWPGPLTLVVQAPPALAEGVAAAGTVGVRVPDHPVTRALVRAVGRPLTATSANVSGRPASDNPDVVERELGAVLDLLLDAGITPGGAPSTIVDVTAAAPRLIRRGAIPWEAVDACVRLG